MWFDHRAYKHTGGWRKHSPETLLFVPLDVEDSIKIL